MRIGSRTLQIIITTNSTGNSIFSTADEIRPEQSDQGYRIRYTLDEIKKIGIVEFLTAVSKMFADNLPGKIFQLYLMGDAEEDCKNYRHELFLELADNSENYPNMVVLYHGDDDDEEDDEETEPYGGSIFGSITKEVKKEKGRSKRYWISSSIRNAKNPKRNIRRHNIIITDKEAYKRDEKVIQEFLKYFLPGKSKWIKGYRREIARRWLSSFVIKEKEARKRRKEFSKKQREQERRSKNKKRVKAVNGVVRTVSDLASGKSPFYDPKL